MAHQEALTATQAVLGALAGISGAVIVAAVMTRLYPDRYERSMPVALFEAIVVAVIIISAMLTAESALVALFDDQKVSSEVMSQIAWPLAFAVVLLIILAMASRLGPSTRNPWVMGPILVSVVYLAAAGGIALDLNLSSGKLWNFVVFVLGSGALIAFVSWRIERAVEVRSVRSRRAELLTRWRRSYEVEERELKVGVPGVVGPGLRVRCWTKGNRVLLDDGAARSMQRQIDEHWRAACEAPGIMPRSSAILTELTIKVLVTRPWRRRLEFSLHDGATNEETERIGVEARDGWFDITDTGLI
jgi:hypothetical protein